VTGKLATRNCREDYEVVELPGDESRAALFSAVDLEWFTGDLVPPIRAPRHF
jgi:hypothetical protein